MTENYMLGGGDGKANLKNKNTLRKENYHEKVC
ncbi:Uncharacterised protein [Streptococcus suis]|uniref:Uncharacterized protein n=1 Tax=Streptococcus suis TaxID=1307 RepID=A0A116LUG5_STRSU|nr:Uncharacterised protein [Streptococcus suis]CYV11795.1 Uncharacterised protein [Streptococcus suis]CYV31877.1 Uncharacterised protein [Streptococcus suis]CYV31909.1 Uncharacterised protein [Streptococcus suis]